MSTTQKTPRLGGNPLRALNGTATPQFAHGKRISATVQDIETKLLKVNPVNSRFFKPLTVGEMQNLIENIRQNGIHDPLIAKNDYTLIAGHNRLEAARELGLSRVPVRFVDGDFTQEEEIRFIVADNLVRRHLTSEEKINLYKVLYPDFDARIAQRMNSHVQSSVQSVEMFHTQDVEPLTAREIAQETGQTKAAVQKQLQAYQRSQQREAAQNRRTQEAIAITSAGNSAEKIRAMEREAKRLIQSSLDEIAMQLSREDLSVEFRREWTKRGKAALNAIESTLAVG